MKKRLASLAAVLGAFIVVGCQQKMAQQPYYKPLEETSFFEDGRSARPLEKGVVHRAQPLDADPLVTGLTGEEWVRYWKADESKTAKGPPAVAVPEAKTADQITAAARAAAFGAPRYDQRKGGEPKVYAEEFPFAMTDADLRRGQRQFSAYCAVCHGPLGNGKGKIWERGYLKPTSYHVMPVEEHEPVVKRDGEGKDVPRENWAKTAGRFFDVGGGEVPLGFSRGYWRWGVEMPVGEVPPGYIFEVVTRGFGAMPDHASQIKPDDRWRIVAYVRTLQYSRNTTLFGGKPQ
jgi:mono/diheme cytochrome c family protein